jgi:hypothetical protein
MGRHLFHCRCLLTLAAAFFLSAVVWAAPPEGARRQAPAVLAPDEGHIEVVFTCLNTYVFDSSFTRMLAMVKTGTAPGPPLSQNRLANLLKIWNRPPSPSSMMGGMGAGGNPLTQGGGNRSGMGGMPGMGGMAGMPGLRGAIAPGSESMVIRKRKNSAGVFLVLWVAPDQFEKDTKLTPADLPRAVRMALIAASFPLRRQVEEFRSKLGLASLQEVLEEGYPEPAFRFLGVDLERRVLDDRGAPVTNYAPVDLQGSYRPWMLHSGLRFEADYRRLAPLCFPGLVMPRLQLFTGAGPKGGQRTQYPPVEDQLQNLKATLARLHPARIAGPYARSEESLDVFTSSLGRDLPSPPRFRQPRQTAVVVEHCLVRVLDTTIEPGQTYQYRLRVRLANPNQERKDVATAPKAQSAELPPGPWYEIPQKVVVPPELLWYVVDQKEVEGGAYTGLGSTEAAQHDRKVILQLHRWMDSLPVSGRDNSEVIVGGWYVAERVAIYRGEPIGGQVYIDLPCWRFETEVLALPSDGFDQKRGRLVNFGPNQIGSIDDPLLVDFEGGHQVHRKSAGPGKDKVLDTSTYEVLALSGTGKLLSHKAPTDLNDTTRLETLRAWRSLVREARSSPQGKPGGPGDVFGP